MRGTQRNPELASGGHSLPLLGECSRNPSVFSVPTGIVVRSHDWFQLIFFEESVKVFAYFMMVIYEHTCPCSAECLAVFKQKRHDPHAPFSPFT